MNVGKGILGCLVAVLTGVGAYTVGRKCKTALDERIKKDGAETYGEWLKMTVEKKKPKN